MKPPSVINPQIIYIGAPEAPAAVFAERARSDFPGLKVLSTDDRNMALDNLTHAEALIGHHFQFDNDMLARAPRLRWIQSLTTGTDGILKLPALRPEVTVTSTRGMHGPQMSELVFLQMLALLRDFPRVQRNQSAGLWERWPQPLLWGKTAVIVGVGAIAEVLAPRCQVFGMKVYGVSSSARIPSGFDGMFDRSELTKAAALADFLVLIVPLSASTKNLIDAKVLAAMKKSAYLINVARGGVLDEEALMAALRDEQIAGAALDVFREQPLPPQHPLWIQKGVIVTPLIGGMSDIYLDQAYDIVRINLQNFLEDRMDSMRNIVAH